MSNTTVAICWGCNWLFAGCFFWKPFFYATLLAIPQSHKQGIYRNIGDMRRRDCNPSDRWNRCRRRMTVPNWVRHRAFIMVYICVCGVGGICGRIQFIPSYKSFESRGLGGCRRLASKMTWKLRHSYAATLLNCLAFFSWHLRSCPLLFFVCPFCFVLFSLWHPGCCHHPETLKGMSYRLQSWHHLDVPCMMFAPRSRR